MNPTAFRCVRAARGAPSTQNSRAQAAPILQPQRRAHTAHVARATERVGVNVSFANAATRAEADGSRRSTSTTRWRSRTRRSAVPAWCSTGTPTAAATLPTVGARGRCTATIGRVSRGGGGVDRCSPACAAPARRVPAGAGARTLGRARRRRQRALGRRAAHGRRVALRALRGGARGRRRGHAPRRRAGRRGRTARGDD